MSPSEHLTGARPRRIILRSLARTLDVLVVACGLIAVALLITVAVSITYDSVGRAAFAHPTAWATEVATNAMVGAVFLGIPYALHAHQHIRVDILLVRLPQAWRSALERISMGIVALFALILTWKGIELVVSTVHADIVTPILHFPVYLVHATAPLCGALLCAEALRLVVTGFAESGDGNGQSGTPLVSE